MVYATAHVRGTGVCGVCLSLFTGVLHVGKVCCPAVQGLVVEV